MTKERIFSCRRYSFSGGHITSNDLVSKFLKFSEISIIFIFFCHILSSKIFIISLLFPVCLELIKKLVKKIASSFLFLCTIFPQSYEYNFTPPSQNVLPLRILLLYIVFLSVVLVKDQLSWILFLPPDLYLFDFFLTKNYQLRLFS